jgi:hypothetical protein
LCDFLPVAVHDGNISLALGARGILRDLDGNDFRFCNRVVISRAIQTRRIYQPVSIFDVEKVAWHERIPTAYCGDKNLDGKEGSRNESPAARLNLGSVGRSCFNA